MDARTRCPNCDSTVEALAYCGVCGRALPRDQTEPDTSIRGRVERVIASIRRQPDRTVVLIAAVAMFIVLLSGNAALAAIIGLVVLPYLLVSYLTRLDLYEREPWTLMAGVVGAGAVVGLLGGWVASLLFDRLWFGDPRLNIGAAGFAGISASGEGSVPFGVLLLNGILIPVILGAAVLGGPIFLRRWSVFRNEILDGFTLGGLAAAGFATLSAMVYFWPAATTNLPDRPVSDWTAIIAGIGVVRPIVLILSGSMLGAAIWQYTAGRKITDVIIPGVGGLIGWLGLAIGSLLFMPSGAVTEFIWYLIVLVIVGFVFREALARGLAQDREQLAGADGTANVVCPNCSRLTPEGVFCSFCGAPLGQSDRPAIDAGRGAQSTDRSQGPATMNPIANPATDEPRSAGDVPSDGNQRDVAGEPVNGVSPDSPLDEETDLAPGRPDGSGGRIADIRHDEVVEDDYVIGAIPDEGEPAWLTDALAGEDDDPSGREVPSFIGDASKTREADAPERADEREHPVGATGAGFSWRTIREETDVDETPASPTTDDEGTPENPIVGRWQWGDREAAADDEAQRLTATGTDQPGTDEIDQDAERGDHAGSSIQSSSNRWFDARSARSVGPDDDSRNADSDEDESADRQVDEAAGESPEEITEITEITEVSRMTDEGGPSLESDEDTDTATTTEPGASDDADNDYHLRRVD